MRTLRPSDHLQRLPRVRCDRLFYQHADAPIDHVQGYGVVARCGHHDRDGVQVLAFEHFAVIHVPACKPPANRAIERVRIAVGDCYQLNVVQLVVDAHVLAAHVAQADNADFHRIHGSSASARCTSVATYMRSTSRTPGGTGIDSTRLAAASAIGWYNPPPMFRYAGCRCTGMG